MKKAQGISINVIIIAAIALLVLVILAVLVINSGRGIGDKTKTCEVQGGTCGDDSCDEGVNEIANSNCGEDRYCCPLFATGTTE
jgi:hypothetical protein